MTLAASNYESSLDGSPPDQISGKALLNKCIATELLACTTISLTCTLRHTIRDGWDWKHISALMMTLFSPIAMRASAYKPLHGLKITRLCADPLGLSAGVALLPGAVGLASERGAVSILSSAFWTAVMAVLGIRMKVTIYVAMAVLFLSIPLANTATSLAAIGAPCFGYLLLVSCRKSFSVAEAAAVGAAMSAALSTACQILLQSQVVVREEGDVGSVVSLGLAGCVLLWVFSVLPCAAINSKSFDLPQRETFLKRRAFWTGCSFCLVILITYIAVWLKGTGREPIFWVTTFISSRNGWGLVFAWVVVVTLIIVVVRPDRSEVEKVVARKFYHLVAALVFGMGLAIDRDLVRLGAVVGLGLLSLGELIRVTGYGKASKFVIDLSKRLIDERDAGSITVTHVYLFLGCAVPIWIADGSVSHAGIVSVCVQDAVAAAVGKRLGVHNWGTRGRTLEGSLAGFVAATATMVLCSEVSLASASIAAAATAVVEAYTEQIDNWVVPMTFSTVVAAFH